MEGGALLREATKARSNQAERPLLLGKGNTRLAEPVGLAADGHHLGAEVHLADAVCARRHAGEAVTRDAAHKQVAQAQGRQRRRTAKAICVAGGVQRLAAAGHEANCGAARVDPPSASCALAQGFASTLRGRRWGFERRRRLVHIRWRRQAHDLRRETGLQSFGLADGRAFSSRAELRDRMAKSQLSVGEAPTGSIARAP